MKKKVFMYLYIFFGSIILLFLFDSDFYMDEKLEFIVPILTYREKIELKERSLFDAEEVRKIYLSKMQMRYVLKKIQSNDNWKNTEIDERLEERLRFHSREDIYYKIPTIEKKYWIFTNGGNGEYDKHSIEYLLNDIYYNVSLGILDLDNHILYYYHFCAE